jgi:hypothetical protein
MQLTNEFDPIFQWANKCGIIHEGNLKTQGLKVVEEVGELSRAILAEDRAEIVDAIGDIVIVLTSLARLAEQHFTDRCTSCRGLGGEIAKRPDEDGTRRWIECQDRGRIDIESCINKAFDVIKNRTGKMNNGTFVKNK